MKRFAGICYGIAFAICVGSDSFALSGAPAFLDSSFEDYAVPDGSHLSSAGAPWSFFQNSFVVDPFFAQVYGAGNARAATYAPHQGEQYVSTYAGNGGVRQNLTFEQPGVYRVSVYAASPSGSLFVQTPVSSGTFPMQAGEFQFRFGTNTLFGETHTTPAGAGWSQFSSLLTINTAGTYFLGTDNTKQAIYFIYYDDFDLEFVGPIPEPASMTLGLSLIGVLLLGFNRIRYPINGHFDRFPYCFKVKANSN